MTGDFWSKRTVVLITGASQAIGSNLAQFMAKKLGPESLLILSSRSKQRLQQLIDTTFQTNPGLAVHLCQWDLSKPSAETFRNDLINSCLRDSGTTPASFEQAVIFHNAAALGDMSRKVAEMTNVDELHHQLDVNLVSTLVLNSVFLEVFHEVSKRIVVNMTAPSAVKPRPSFGMTSMVKSSRQILFSILAHEEPEVKVLHFDPVAVDSDSLRAIRDTSHDPEIRSWIQGFYDRNEILKPEKVVSSLARILEEEKFQSGQILDALHFDK